MNICFWFSKELPLLSNHNIIMFFLRFFILTHSYLEAYRGQETKICVNSAVLLGHLLVLLGHLLVLLGHLLVLLGHLLVLLGAFTSSLGAFTSSLEAFTNISIFFVLISLHMQVSKVTIK